MSDPNQPTTAADHHEDKADETEPDVHFEPVVKLEKVELTDSEAMETCLFKMRAKLFRFDKSATEWKERGTGDMKLLMHTQTGKVRVLMRREKTLKICANHYITPEMKLNPNVGSDRSWVWTALADFSDEQVKPEMLAARFANSDLAQRFKAKFEEAQAWNVALANNSKSPNDLDHMPKPDPDAVEAKPELGSMKLAAAPAASVKDVSAPAVSAGSVKDVSAPEGSVKDLSGGSHPKLDSQPSATENAAGAADHVVSETVTASTHVEAQVSASNAEVHKEETAHVEVETVKQEITVDADSVKVEQKTTHATVDSVKQETEDAKVEHVTDALAVHSIDAHATEGAAEEKPATEST